MPKRPTSVTVIGVWFVVSAVVTGVFTPLSTAVLYSDPVAMRTYEELSTVPLGVGLLWSVVAGVLVGTAGVAMLTGRGWGRRLYLFSGPVAILYGLVTSLSNPLGILSTVPAIVFYGVVFYFLTRPAVSEFFAARSAMARAAAPAAVPSVAPPPQWPPAAEPAHAPAEHAMPPSECPACGQTNVDDASFCARCGMRLRTA